MIVFVYMNMYICVSMCAFIYKCVGVIHASTMNKYWSSLCHVHSTQHFPSTDSSSDRFEHPTFAYNYTATYHLSRYRHHTGTTMGTPIYTVRYITRLKHQYTHIHMHTHTHTSYNLPQHSLASNTLAPKQNAIYFTTHNFQYRYNHI